MTFGTAIMLIFFPNWEKGEFGSECRLATKRSDACNVLIIHRIFRFEG